MTPSRTIKQEAVRHLLDRTTPFNLLAKDQLDILLTNAVSRDFEKGESICYEGAPAENIWIVDKGLVAEFLYTAQGVCRAVGSVGPGEVFGPMDWASTQKKAYATTGVAVLPSTVVRLWEHDLMSVCRQTPSMALSLCTLLSVRLLQAQREVCSAYDPVEKRIAAILMQLSKIHGNAIPMTRRDVAALASTTVESTIRTLSLFGKKGWLMSSRGHIDLCMVSGLQKLLEPA